MAAQIGIIMGSDSDLEVMEEAAKACEEFGIEYEMHVMSAHRSPDETANFAKTAHQRSFKVIIAGAGGAAHLAGVIAAHTPLPVIGIPVKSKTLQGQDSLLSMVQMPPGVPVATVAIDGGRNAGLLAVQMLALHDPALLARVVKFKEQLAEGTREKDRKLQERLQKKRKA
jgi:5-(carboxyamino)imidazole ribonucleotide mutase